MRKAFWAVTVLVTLCMLGACRAASVGTPADSADYDVQQWPEFERSAEYEPLDKRMENFAAEAEALYTRRIRKKSPVVDGEYLANCAKRVYVLSDRPITIEPGVPELIAAKNLDELEQIARETKNSLVYIELKCLGQTTVRGKKGVVIQCDASVVESDRAAWKALPVSEKADKPLPDFGVSDYRWTTVGFVTRVGRTLLVLDGSKVVV